MASSENIISLIPMALEYYDLNTEKYRSLKKKIKSHRIITSKSNLKRNTIVLYDGEGKELLTSEFEVCGIYNDAYKLWAWAWSRPNFSKNMTTISRKILNYGFDLTSTESTVLKTELITSRFKISSPVQIDIHLALASFLSKNPLIFELEMQKNKMSPRNIFYLFLTDAKAIGLGSE